MKTLASAEPLAFQPNFETAEHLIFSLDGALYGVPAHAVREVLALPPITTLHELPPLFLGVTHLRDRFLPVADLNRCLGKSAALPSSLSNEVSDAAKVLVVLEFRGSVAAFVVSEVCDVCSIHEQNISFLSRGEAHSESGSRLAGVARLDGRNLQVLHLPSLFDLIAPFYQQVSTTPTTAPTDTEEENEWPLVAIVRLRNELFGFPLEWVREFASLGALTPVPGCPASVVGLMNLRGEVLSLLDVRPALQLPDWTREAAQGDSAPKEDQVVVVECEGWRVGLLVDEVIDIFGLPRHAVAPIVAGDLLSGTAWFDSQMLSLVDVPKLLQQERLALGES